MKVQAENVKRKSKEKLGKFSSQYPLLKKEAEYWGISIPEHQPIGNGVVVYRLPPLTETPGGLLIPDDHQSPHVKGILLAASAKALDYLESNGVTLGHTVIFKRFAGTEINDHEPEALKGCRILLLEASDIIGSDNLRKDLESGRASYTKVDGKHNLTVKAISDKKAKVLKLAADPAATPAERETARKLAAKL